MRCAAAAAAVLGLRSLLLLGSFGIYVFSTRPRGSPEFQSFVDFYPVTRFPLTVIHRVKFGATGAQVVPGLLARFDWFQDHFESIIWQDWSRELVKSFGCAPDHFRSSRDIPAAPLDPLAVYTSPWALKGLLSTAPRYFDVGRADRVLVFGTNDLFLSDLLGTNAEQAENLTRRIRRYFKVIFYQAKDIDAPGFEVLPFGLDESYLRGGVAASAAAAIAAATLSSASKPHAALYPCDKYWKREWIPDYLIDHKGTFAAKMARIAGRDWAASAVARDAGVVQVCTEARAWWPTLASHRLMLMPLASGIQSPKMVEALLVLTVPVGLRHGYPVLDGLRSRGFPVVAIDAWSEVTAEGLDHWWKELAPRLPRFRAACLTAEAYWQLIVGADSDCWSPV